MRGGGGGRGGGREIRGEGERATRVFNKRVLKLRVDHCKATGHGPGTCTQCSAMAAAVCTALARETDLLRLSTWP